MQRFTIDAVVDLCEQTFGYEFALGLAAVREAFVVASLSEENTAAFATHADLLQKRLKYGLPSQDAISYFETGFSERVVAQKVANVIWEVAKSPAEARALVKEHVENVEPIMKTFPSYFEAVFEAITT